MSKSSSIPEELIKIQAHKIWMKRQREGIGGTPESDWNEAKEYLKKHWWEVYLWRLNRPFIWLEKRIIEPLDRWSERANIFNFFSKLSPFIEAIGLLALPGFLFYLQLRSEENLISVQAEVRHQQAVRDYLSQVTTIHLETDQGKKIKDDKELKTLLEATTLALFNELSISEGSSREAGEAIKRDRKGQVVKFLSGLGWIKGSEREEPLLSLQDSNLSLANLFRAYLFRAYLVGSDLTSANLSSAYLTSASLRGANLSSALTILS